MRTPPTGREPDEQRLEARRASASRDAGLRRVSRLTGLTVAIAVGLTGILSEVAAHALPGRSKDAAAASTRAAKPDRTSAAPKPQPSNPQPSNPQPSNPQPPEQAPAPSTASGGAVSGGS
jgi:hypothetical protein